MLGLNVEEYVVYPEGLTNTIRTTDGRMLTCSHWSDVIHTQGSEPLAEYEHDYFTGLPAITRHKYGKGIGFYLGTQLEADGIDWLLGLVCTEAEINSVVQNLPAGVEALRRSKDGNTWLFLLNHTNRRIQIPLEATGFDLLTGEAIDGSVALETNGVAVIELNNKP
jgi:beta-galactosidase